VSAALARAARSAQRSALAPCVPTHAPCAKPFFRAAPAAVPARPLSRARAHTPLRAGILGALTDALAPGALPGAGASALSRLNPSVFCPALAASGCCATSLLAAAASALSLTCSPQRDLFLGILGTLPVRRGASTLVIRFRAALCVLAPHTRPMPTLTLFRVCVLLSFRRSCCAR
jgi:hypothetical protein